LEPTPVESLCAPRPVPPLDGIVLRRGAARRHAVSPLSHVADVSRLFDAARHAIGGHVDEVAMIYLKGILVGVLAAMAASVFYVLAVFVVPILFPFLLSRITGNGGVAAASFSTGPVLGIALAAFAVGFYWEFRRASRTRRHAS
jgi:hypothetical protein